MRINFDMDGTIADLYGVDNWLLQVRAFDPSPYKQAAPLVNMSRLAHYLNKLQQQGHELCIVSWLSRDSCTAYDEAVTAAKINWLKRHLPSVNWNHIYIVPYGTNKWEVCKEGILFDDDVRVRTAWCGNSYEPSMIFDTLIELARAD